MSNTSTATVETLSAEVRVLMVGSRQVTQSVYNQLDSVTDDKIVPFGRVATKDNDGHVHIVGKHAETGGLVRASLPLIEYATRDWVSARSSRAVMDRKARRAFELADELTGKADKAEQDAAEKLTGTGYWSAPVAEKEQDKHEAEAAMHEAEAEAAAGEIGRLKALAKAAGSRQRAADASVRAAEACAEAERLQLAVVQYRQDAGQHLAQGEELQAGVQQWARWEESEATRVTDLAVEWSELPLIVLAGLR